MQLSRPTVQVWPLLSGSPTGEWTGPSRDSAEGCLAWTLTCCRRHKHCSSDTDRRPVAGQSVSITEPQQTEGFTETRRHKLTTPPVTCLRTGRERPHGPIFKHHAAKGRRCPGLVAAWCRGVPGVEDRGGKLLLPLRSRPRCCCCCRCSYPWERTRRVHEPAALRARDRDTALRHRGNHTHTHVAAEYSFLHPCTSASNISARLTTSPNSIYTSAILHV